MREQWQLYRDKFLDYWKNLSNRQRMLIIGTFLFLILSMTIFFYIASKPKYVPLYSNELSAAEIGQIKEELESQGYTRYKLTDSGGQILVPKKDAADIVVDLAAQGLPKEGNISYEVFSENLNFGATDRQLDVIERDAMQNELSRLLERVDGIQHADVMITLPEESVFVRSDQQDQSTASIIVSVDPGQSLSQTQIRSLYHLVSRSVPKLPLENIVIMNQYSEMLELTDTDEEDLSTMTQYQRQRKIKRQIEQDIQRDLQNMLGTIMGRNSVLVHTYVKLNFDKVQTHEERVEPVDEETNEGIAISVEEISKSYQGSNASAGGVAGPAEGDIPGYQSASGTGDSEYEELQERVNFEVNRISRDIVQSPYEIEDITINVGVEPPPGEETLDEATQENIRNILENVVRTALAENEQTLTQEEIEQRISVFQRTFDGKPALAQDTGGINPTLLYVLAGVAALSVGSLAFMLIRRRREADVMEESEDTPRSAGEVEVPPMEFDENNEKAVVRKQLENMAKERPEDFAKLLRTWLAED